MEELKGSQFNYLYYVKEFEKYIMFNTNSCKWIEFDEVGKMIYELIDKYHNITEVCKNIAKEYCTTTETIELDVKQFLKQLKKDGFVIGNEEIERKHIINEEEEFLKYPYNTLIISVASVCNLDCIYCFNKEKRQNDIGNSSCITVNNEKYIKDAITQFKAWGGLGVLFTGGEPLLCEKLVDLCAYAKKVGLSTKVITNVTKVYSYSKLEELLQSLDEITLSLDSTIQEELEILWNEKKIDLKEIYAGLCRINDFSKKIKKVNVTISPIITKVNSHNIDQLIKKTALLLQDCMVKYELTKYQDIQKDKVDKFLSITQEEYEKIYTHSFRNAGIDNKLVRYNAATRNGKYIPYPIANVFRCKPSLYINTDGSVYPCQSLVSKEYYLGNIEKDSFENIKNKFLNSMRKVCLVKDSNCISCEFKYICPYKGGICQKEKHANCKEELLRAMCLSLA